MDLYLTKYGDKLSKRGNSFLVVSDEKSYLLSPEKIETVVIETNVMISSEAIKLAIEKDIDIILTDEYGELFGHFCKINYSKGAKLRKKQYELFSSEEGLKLAKRWIVNKILKQKEHVDYLLKKRNMDREITKKFDDAVQKIRYAKMSWNDYKDAIRGIEGNIGKVYYKIISDLLDKKWKFAVREHRKAKAPYNIVLNYTFGILYRLIQVRIVREGFDPAMGILHVEGEGKNCFVYDFIEKYRYLAFESTFKMFYDRVIKDNFFQKDENNNVVLSIEGKRVVSSYFKEVLNKGEKVEKKNLSIQSIVKKEIKELKKELLAGLEESDEE